MLLQLNHGQALKTLGRQSAIIVQRDTYLRTIVFYSCVKLQRLSHTMPSAGRKNSEKPYPFMQLGDIIGSYGVYQTSSDSCGIRRRITETPRTLDLS